MTLARGDEIQAFLDQAGWGGAEVTPLPGDASTRRYMRVDKDRRCALLMDQPQHAETPFAPLDATPEDRRALGYNAVARLAGADCGRFIAVAEYLRGQGLSAPDIYAADIGKGFVLIEDLGDALYADVLTHGGDETALYRAAVETLAQIHARPAPDQVSAGKPLYPYDETAMLAEIDLMTEWFMPLALGRTVNPEETKQHRALWHAAFASLPPTTPVFVHRDYHAQNLIWLPERAGANRVGMIDFQDAVAGRRSYDLVSLLEDARRDVSPELARAMTAHYLDAVNLDAVTARGNIVDPSAFRAEMAVMAAQRNAKIAGIFARLCRRDGKPRYLGYLPRVWTYLERDLAHPSLAALRAWYDDKIPRDRRWVPEREQEGTIA